MDAARAEIDALRAVRDQAWITWIQGDAFRISHTGWGTLWAEFVALRAAIEGARPK